MKLTDDELRAVYLPDDPRLPKFLEVVEKGPLLSWAEMADLRVLRRALPTTKATWTLDAMGTLAGTVSRWSCFPAKDPPWDAKPENVLFGQGVQAKLLRACLSALIGKSRWTVPGEIHWYGRYQPIVLVAKHTGSSDLTKAVVMPVQLCVFGGDGQRGEGYFGGTRDKPPIKYTCLCRDCAAGRTWGWR